MAAGSVIHQVTNPQPRQTRIKPASVPACLEQTWNRLRLLPSARCVAMWWETTAQ